MTKRTTTHFFFLFCFLPVLFLFGRTEVDGKRLMIRLQFLRFAGCKLRTEVAALSLKCQRSPQTLSLHSIRKGAGAKYGRNPVSTLQHERPPRRKTALRARTCHRFEFFVTVFKQHKSHGSRSVRIRFGPVTYLALILHNIQ